MPIVTIETWPLKNDMKKELIQKITEVFSKTGIPAQAVTIVIHDTPMENWGSGGELHSEKFKDMMK
ncbi:MAG: tautomerase family protein [Nanoarchaeota archaeon]|nr:tautomerase family protein [Nanoarchaeota archaeon]MBU1321173.1 tautomerase family protein [Nanoarchaeota archaeon]MBU1598325.1 tautomerase family protein [Nanoarchaeota archaeon]MBU2442287.1 tautomerase family protein [Nanoarchaeota archaeon]